MKTKNILFAYHRLDILGGIETRWIDEFKYLQKNSFKVHVAVPKVSYKAHIGKTLSPDNIILIDSNKIERAVNFLALVHEITQAIKLYKIDIISVHMQDLFALAAVIAAQRCKIPVISTIHGTPDIYRIPLHRLLIQNLASKSYSLAITVSGAFRYLLPQNDLKKHTIPNLIDFNKFNDNEYIPDYNKWLLVSRISPEKYPSIIRFIEAASISGISEIDIAGGGISKDLKHTVNKLDLNVKVNFLGEIKEVYSHIPKYYGVAGMGRAAIEGLACKRPVCIVSIDGSLIGLATESNLETLIEFNFTGRGLVPISNEHFQKQLKAYKKHDSELIHSKLIESLDIENWNKYIKLYDDLNFIENSALEALYHKICYFANTLRKPFFEDELFQHLFYETLIEYKMNDIKELWDYYEDSIGLSFEYPMPFSTNKKKRKSVLNKKKILFW